MVPIREFSRHKLHAAFDGNPNEFELYWVLYYYATTYSYVLPAACCMPLIYPALHVPDRPSVRM